MAVIMGQIGIIQDNTIATSYTSTTNQNIMTPGPVTVNTGVTVTIATGSRWVVV
jgi:hypothetical protein